MPKDSFIQSYSLRHTILSILSIFVLAVPLLASFSQPALMTSSDYLMDFYPAGKLLLEHRPAEIYNSTANTLFTATSFNRFAHELLPSLPADKIAVYMYSPLTALVFCPYSIFSPQVSLILWQVTSTIAFALAIFLISSAVGSNFKSSYLIGLLCLAVFHTILIGQLGIILGLLPFALGYYLFSKKQEFFAGFCWSFLLLKPQFLPVAFLLSLSFAFNKKFRCLLGLISGLILLTGLGCLIFTPTLFDEWISSLKLSDTIFSNPHYSYPVYLITSLPATILHCFPIAWRNIIKIPAYSMAFLFSLQALWLSVGIVKKLSFNSNYATALVTIIGIALLPLILPHFLFYDFSAFALLVALFNCSIWTQKRQLQLKVLAWLYLMSIDVYFVCLMSPAKVYLQPGVLVAIMCFLYYRLTKIIINVTSEMSTEQKLPLKTG